MSNNQSAGKGDSETDLHAAAWSGDIDWAKDELVSGIEVNVADSIGETPLHGAAAWGRTEMVKFLLDQGADPTIKSNDGLTPLHWACSHGNKEVVSLLIGKGALLEESIGGLTPMEIAKKYDKHEIVQWLKNNT